jgi:hypothetical protein
MITSHTITGILEDFLIGKKLNPGGYLEIFTNPSLSEFKEMIKRKDGTLVNYGEIRFIADAKKRILYAWNAYIGTHNDARQILGMDPNTEKTPYLLNGTAVVRGKPRVTQWDDFIYHINEVPRKGTRRGDLAYNFLSQAFSYDWSWLDKYMTCSNFLKFRKYEFDQKVELRDKNA